MIAQFRHCFLLAVAGVLILAAASADAKTRTPGDVNGDGRLSLADAVLTLRAAVGLPVPANFDAQEADVWPSPGTGPREAWRYGDGRITKEDAMRLLRAIIGIEPIGDNWPPAMLNWLSPFLPLNSGDGLRPGQPVLARYDWAGPGPGAFRVDPASAGTFFLLNDDRSAFFVARSPSTDDSFTMIAGSAPFTAQRLGVIRSISTEGAPDLAISTDRRDYPPLMPVTITVTVSASPTAGWTWPAGVTVYAFDNETHREVWEARDPNWTSKVEVAAGQKRSWSMQWNWRDSRGQFVQPRTYTLFAILGLDSVLVAGPVQVTRIAVG